MSGGHGQMHLTLDEGRAMCLPFRGSNPILEVDTGTMRLTISAPTYTTGVAPVQVRLARDLAIAADQYAAALERRYYEQRYPAQPIPAPRFDPEFDVDAEIDPWAVVHPPPGLVDPAEYTDEDYNADCAMRDDR